MRKHVPNTLTLLNLVSGCIAITHAFDGNFMQVVVWVIIAAVFDFFDGLAARLLNAPSAIGKELDSLADVVSFGVAPAIALFVLLRDHTLITEALTPIKQYIPYIAFIIPAFSALRLAKFNIDDRQTSSFIGMPTPANGLFWICYAYGVKEIAAHNQAILYITIAFVVIMSLLMVAEIPMFALKMKNLSLRNNVRQAILVALMIAFVAMWGIIGISGGILAYIVISVLSVKTKNHHQNGNGNTSATQ